MVYKSSVLKIDPSLLKRLKALKDKDGRPIRWHGDKAIEIYLKKKGV